MQLRQVQHVNPKPLQRSIGGRAHPLFRVFVRVEISHAPELGCQKEAARTLLKKLADESFATTAAVNVCGVEKGDAGIGGSVKNAERQRIIDVAPIRSTELPAAEANFGDSSIRCA